MLEGNERSKDVIKLTKAVNGSKPKLELTRVLDAPRKLVWAAWTKAEHVAQWFAPGPLTVPSCEVDLRPGGVFRLTMRAPDGTPYPFEGKFGEVVPLEKIVFTGLIHDDNAVETTVTFADEGTGKTRLQVVQTYAHESDATRGAPKGWGKTLDQLEGFAKRG